MKRKSVDWILASAVTGLLIMGLIMVFSASSMIAKFEFGNLMFFFQRQILWGAISLISMVAFSKIDYRIFKRHGLPLILMLSSILLLAGLFGFGAYSHGARRWYNLKLMRFQPSELAKLSVIIYTSYYLSAKESRLKDWKKGLLPLITLIGLTVLLIYPQPDLSTSLMILLLAGLLVFVSPVPLKHLAGVALAAVPFAIFALVRNPYQWGRIHSWWVALHNPANAAYQLKQSLIGLGRGGIVGHGLGQSVQKFLFLPDSHTDFIFSIVGEEFGFLGASVILILFLLIFFRGISITRNVHDKFGRYLALGITLNIVLYAFINAGVVSALLPTTGLPMPFFSYGGSSLLFLSVATGILLNISRHTGSEVESIMENNQTRELFSKKIVISAE
ncbi:putative lipid II flippase FtsW [candidate division KSB1 bacterium]|nr:MAG: putative lipid II flippase FtsW [candidate division KSB1 bacterium]